MSEEVEPTSTAKMVKIYIKMRDKRKALASQFEEADKVIKEQMETLEREFMQVCNNAGASSVNVAGAGTIIRGQKSRYWTSDWGSMYDFIKEKNMPELLERRVSQTTMKEFLQQNPDQMPKGLNVDTEYTITVRRA